MQERRNSIANALELHLSCANPSIYDIVHKVHSLILIGNGASYMIYSYCLEWWHSVRVSQRGIKRASEVVGDKAAEVFLRHGDQTGHA